MLLRSLWCRLGTRLSVEKKPVFKCALTSISQSTHPHKNESNPGTNWVHSRTSLNTHRHPSVGRVLTGLGGLKRFTRTSVSCGVVATCSWGQTRPYSTNPVNLMLKPHLKSAVLPGKRVPKGPRTKQPSRTNQPSLKEDKVAHMTTPHDSCYVPLYWISNLLLSAGYDAMYCFCNSRSVSLTNTFPWFDKPRLLWDRFTSRYSSQLFSFPRSRMWFWTTNTFWFQMLQMCWWSEQKRLQNLKMTL